jgi:tetratricopeptide (TPR) repeat protein
MATNLAETLSSDSDLPAPRERPWGQLWQAPLFFVGTAALAVVLIARPFANPCNPARLSERLIEEIRGLVQVNRGAAEASEALEKAKKLLERPDLPAARRGETDLLAGTAHIRLAELGLDGPAEEHWKAARELLEEAARRGVPDSDAGRLRYRLAKVIYRLGTEPEKAVELLAEAVENGGDPAEGYALLTEAYEKLPKPDYRAALAANEKLRQVPLVGEEVLLPARLKGGELLLKLQKPEEARKVLEKIGTQAPPALFTRARSLRARSYQDEGRWGEAAALWEATLAEGQVPEAELPRIRYDLGLCYRQNNQPVEAIRVWEQCVKTDGPEARAAGVGLAELYLLRREEGEPGKARAALEQALTGVQRLEDWKNRYLDGPKVLETCERGIQTLAQSGRHEQALELLVPYRRLVPAGKAVRLEADLLAQWARARLEQAELETDPASRGKTADEGRALLRRASGTYLTALEQAPQAEQADLLWLAALAAVEAQDAPQAILLLKRFLKDSTDRARLGQGWYLLGEALRKQKSPEAEEAYENCIVHDVAPYSFRARYQLAEAARLRGQLDKAIERLDQTIKLQEGRPDPETHPRALFAVGDLLFRQHKYQEAARRLYEAIQRYPASPETPRARFELGVSYCRMAEGQHKALKDDTFRDPDTRRHFQEEYRRWLELACAEFEDLGRALERSDVQIQLGPRERAAVPFLAAECRFNLGQYDEALQIYLQIGRRARGGTETLDALGGCAQCYAVTGQWDKLRQTLDQIRAALPGLQDAALRQSWEQWVNLAAQPIPPR